MLPLRLRTEQGIQAGDSFEFMTNGTVIMMLRHAPHCLVCRMNETSVERFGDIFCARRVGRPCRVLWQSRLKTVGKAAAELT